MDKYAFLMALSEKLQSIPAQDAQASLDYYGEMIDDRMDEGLSEEEAVAAIGDLDEIVKNIIPELPASPPEKQETKQKRKLSWWEIVLLVLGSPLWVSLLIAVIAVVFSVWISLWSVVISLYATAVALAASAIGCILGSFFMVAGGPATVMVALGAALVCAGFTILFFMLSNLAAKGMVALTRLTWKGIRRIFAGKERTA